jgi:hypothetical protein
VNDVQSVVLVLLIGMRAKLRCKRGNTAFHTRPGLDFFSALQ